MSIPSPGRLVTAADAYPDDSLIFQLLKILLAGPLKAGYRTDLWTCPRVAEVIANTFHVKYHPAHVWKILRGFGWTPQRPEQRARERDEKAVRCWRLESWLRIKRGRPVS